MQLLSIFPPLSFLSPSYNPPLHNATIISSLVYLPFIFITHPFPNKSLSPPLISPRFPTITHGIAINLPPRLLPLDLFFLLSSPLRPNCFLSLKFSFSQSFLSIRSPSLNLLHFDFLPPSFNNQSSSESLTSSLHYTTSHRIPPSLPAYVSFPLT